MEPNKLESVHTIVCDAIAHHFPDWKDRSRVSYEIAFMLKKYMTHNYCHISIDNNQLVFYPNVQATVELIKTENNIFEELKDFYTKLISK